MTKVVVVEDERIVALNLKQRLTRLGYEVTALVTSGELPVPVSISAGMTYYPADGTDAQTLFAVADARLYEAKRGRAA